MRIGENLRSSLKSLAHNKLRSFLTMLGIIIGIFSVIMLTSIGEGVKKQVTTQIESLGANLLYVFPGKIGLGLEKGESQLGVPQGGLVQRKKRLTYNDVLALKGKKDIYAVTGIHNGVDLLNDLKIQATTTGTDEDLARITDIDLKFGRFITREDRLNKSRVAVIGHQANKELFKGINSIGKTFKIEGKDYKVVGIIRYKKTGNLDPRGEDINIKIYRPITEMLDRDKTRHVHQIMVRATSAERIAGAEQTIRKTLLDNHQPRDFSIIKQQDMLNAINRVLGILTAGLGGIAAISLVVGGIGIMNIMLVSVTERTREIGIRMAIGATRRDIMVQFLIESVFLSIVGGIIGLALGIGGSRLLPAAIPIIQTDLSVPAVIIALAFALLVGIFFGVYPASKAARLDPIEALRNE